MKADRLPRLACLSAIGLAVCCGSVLTSEISHGTRQTWYWDSVVNVHFDNHGRPLAKGISVDRLVSEIESLPVDMIQVGAYGGKGLHASFPWKGNVRGFAQPDSWDSLAVWSEVARRTGKRFHLYTNTFNGITPEDLAAENPQFQGDRYGAGYQKFIKDVFLPILNGALARYHPQGVWVDGSEALINDPTGSRQRIAHSVHQHNAETMMTFNHSWLNLVCGWPDPRTPPPFVDTLSCDRGGGGDKTLACTRVQGMFYSSLDRIPHDIMNAVDKPGVSYHRLLQMGGVTLASGGSWFLWVDRTEGESVLESLETVREAAQWAVQRKPALGRTRSANPTAVLVSETQWKEGGTTYGKLGPAGLAWDDETPLVQACALALQEQGFLVDIVNEEILIEHLDRYRRVFVPGSPKLGKATENALGILESRGSTVVRNAPARPSGHGPDVRAINNTSGCIFSLRRQADSNRYVLHVIDLREQKRPGMAFSLHLPSEPKQVWVYPPSVQIEHTWSGGGGTVGLEAFAVHAAIVFDCEP